MQRLFDSLLARRNLIEATYGEALSWEKLPNRRACRIADYTPGDFAEIDATDRYIDWFFDTGTRLRKAIDAAVSAESLER